LDKNGSINGQNIIAITNAVDNAIPVNNGTNFKNLYVGKKYHSGFMCNGVTAASAGVPNPGGNMTVNVLITLNKNNVMIIIF